MPFFSIITPTYNRANLIGQAIESVIKQSFEDYELIIVDDGSTDDTKSVIDEFNDSRISYNWQENGERGKARNNGVKLAKGEYVFFLDSDDLIYPNHLQHAFERLKTLGFPEFFHSRYEEVFPTYKRQAPPLKTAGLKEKVSQQNQFACQFFLRTDIAKNIPFSENPELKIGEDWEVVLKVAHRYPLNVSNTINAAIVHHGERSMEVASPDTILNSKKILLDNLSNDKDIPVSVIKNVNAELTTLAALSAVIKGEKGRGFKLWRKGVQLRINQLLTRRTLAIFKKILFNGRA